MQQAAGATAEAVVQNVRLRGHLYKVIKGDQNCRHGGYGFIRADDGASYFVHIRDVEPRSDFRVGRHVEFSLLPAPRRRLSPVAVKVIVVA